MSPSTHDGSFTIKAADIRWLNFSGSPTTFNPEGGVRTFNVFLDEQLAADMERDGWNIQTTKPRKDASREEIEEFIPRKHVEVTVKFKFKPPRITMIGNNSKSRTEMTESTCGQLDDAEIVLAHVTIRPHNWDVNGKVGIKAYLKQAVIYIEESDLDLLLAEETEAPL